jgi:hypothetical protein
MNVTVDAPVAGRVVVTAWAFGSSTHTVGTEDSYWAGIEQTGTSCAFFGGSAPFRTSAALPSGTYESASVAFKAFDVQAGSSVFNLNGWKTSTSGPATLQYGQLVAVFYPN